MNADFRRAENHFVEKICCLLVVLKVAMTVLDGSIRTHHQESDAIRNIVEHFRDRSTHLEREKKVRSNQSVIQFRMRASE